MDENSYGYESPEGKEEPTVPGLEQTDAYEPVAQDVPAQPKWQPLPGGEWAPVQPAAPTQPPAPAAPPYSPGPAHPGAPGHPGQWSPGPSNAWTQGGYGAGAPQGGYGAGAPQGGYGAGAPQGPYGAGAPQGPYGYGAPTGGAGGYGGNGGWNGGDYGMGSGTPSDPQGPRRRSALRWAVTVTGVVALVAAAAGIGDALGHQSPSPASTGGSGSIPNVPPASRSSETGKHNLNVSGIAAAVDKSTVDITSVLGQTGEAEGTGMVLTPNGDVLTNNHVVNGATSITAQIDGRGTKYTVKVLGTDPTADVALVQLQGASNLPTVKVGNSAAVQVGDPVVAIGNALGLGGTPTVTSGIVSALGRSITATDSATGSSEHLTGLIQTDAPINPGNSGGPLVNSSGQVIGMNTAADSGSSTQGASNIGFAIPVNEAISVAQKIQKGQGSGNIQIGTRGIMGVEVETIAQAKSQSGIFGSTPSVPASSGAYVAQVEQGSPAAGAGIAGGDVIVALNGHAVSSPTALRNDLSTAHPGTSVSVTWVSSGGARHTASLTLIAGPAA